MNKITAVSKQTKKKFQVQSNKLQIVCAQTDALFIDQITCPIPKHDNEGKKVKILTIANRSPSVAVRDPVKCRTAAVRGNDEDRPREASSSSLLRQNPNPKKKKNKKRNLRRQGKKRIVKS